MDAEISGILKHFGCERIIEAANMDCDNWIDRERRIRGKLLMDLPLVR
jgi:hypothetical protein